jgi:hypothetical protein
MHEVAGKVMTFDTNTIDNTKSTTIKYIINISDCDCDGFRIDYKDNIPCVLVVE